MALASTLKLAIALVASPGLSRLVGVYAGAGANVQACVYFSQVPAKSINTCFVAGGASDHCMNASGQNACVNVTQAGLTCVSVGYVEEKGSSSGGDTCATDHSIWSLAYTAGIYSGSTLSDWSTGWIHNEIYLVSQSPGTNVCPSQALCAVTDLEWDKGSAPSLYFIFRPGTAAVKSKSEGVKSNPAPIGTGRLIIQQGNGRVDIE